MKPSQSTLVAILSIALIGLGAMFHSFLIEFSLSQFKDVSFQVVGIGQIGSPFDLVVVLASIPALFYLVQRYIRIEGSAKVLLFFGIVILFGLLFWWFRMKYLINLTANFQIPNVLNLFPVNKLFFEYYFGLGVLVGTIFNIILFIIINKREELRRKELEYPGIIDN